MRVDITHGMGKFCELCLCGFDDTRVTVARGGNGKSCSEIEILFVVDVPDVHALSAIPHDGPRAVFHEMCNVAAFVIVEKLESRDHLKHHVGLEAKCVCVAGVGNGRGAGHG